ncbi:MAG: hypothetical protein NDI82_06715 [Anaeromyxobacteraceae bacterium]|nr:hypothetical protein [Anaeromyxobacteraceae bacterium]
MIDLAIAAALLLSAETPPAPQGYQAHEKGKGHGVPTQQTAGATAAPVAVPAAQAPAAKPAGKPHPSAYGNREKGGHIQPPAAPEAPAGGEQK